MILGLGFDLIDMDRVGSIYERYGDRFRDRLLTSNEQKKFDTLQGKIAVQYLASRFAAKEAAVKALGTGFTQGISCFDIEVQSAPSGQPLLALHGKAAEIAAKLGVQRLHLTITHTPTTAGAVVILEA